MTKKTGRRHSLKGKRTRAKRTGSKRRTHHKRKRSHKKKRGAHHKRRKHTRSMRGRRGSMHGGSALVPSPWIPSDLTNVYRSGVGGIMDTSNALNGMESDPSPLPYKGQLVGDNNMVGEILRMA
ncbi:MAG TPA: hypothetical protein EYQ00_01185 [Dehalococcoidia bacterium]|nr:hypothetical protein [Dehalococcoidia bacterium]